MTNDKFKALFLAAGLLLLALLNGCAKPIVEYRYIENNCSKAEDLITPKNKMKINFIAVDIDGQRYYATKDAASLLMELGKE